MLFQYKLRTSYSQLVPDIQSRVVQQQQNQKMYYDQKSATRSFQIGDLVLAKNYSLGHRWLSGKNSKTTWTSHIYCSIRRRERAEKTC